jgi:YgiT-type zinc finger domain-containing protein
MNNRDKGLLFSIPRSSLDVTCVSCGSTAISTSIEKQSFVYGQGDDRATVVADVPVHTCGTCGITFSDESAEDIRHEAVCRHLGVMPPAAVAEVRRSYGMSRAAFSALTKIGEASLARWEGGHLIQNPAYDQYLYLLSFSDNVERLTTRRPSPLPKSQTAVERRTSKFRVLKADATTLREAETFCLRRRSA